MARQLTPLGRALIVVSGLAVVGYGLYRYDLLDKIIPKAKERASVVPPKTDLPALPGESNVNVVPAAMPGSGAAARDKPEVRALIWAWNAQMGMIFANGGAQASSGSMMCERGVNLKLIRQDDVSKMQEDLITFANELKRATASRPKAPLRLDHGRRQRHLPEGPSTTRS
jgi:hypothetical protein